MQTVGLLLIVRNEINRIKECLNYHLPYVDQVVVCDQQSDDGTWEYLQEYKAEIDANKGQIDVDFIIFQDINHGYCEPSKQLAADKLTTDWILYIDPDEIFPEVFLKDIHQIVERHNGYDGFTFRRRNIFSVQVFDENVPIEPKVLEVEHPSHDYQLRLTRRECSVFPTFMHHRVRINKDKPNIGKLAYSIEHRKTIDEQWLDNKRYKIINSKRG